MSYDSALADRIREYLASKPGLEISEKEMFRGITFLVDGKMCVCVSADNLMCRFDPELESELAERRGYRPMIMKGKQLAGYCYVDPTGIRSQKDFLFWVDQCLEFNPRAKASNKKATGKKSL